MAFSLVINTRSSRTLKDPKVAVSMFQTVKVNMKYDAFASTFQFDYMFDPNNQDHAEIAGVSHFHEAIISYEHPDGTSELALTGYVLSQLFVDSATPELCHIGGYSKSGILEDCDIPQNCPVQANGLSLRQITERILSYLIINGQPILKLVASGSQANSALTVKKEVEKEVEKEVNFLADKSIDDSTAPEARNIREYLVKLARQKNIVFTHNSEGNPVIKAANTDGEPLFFFDADLNPMKGYTKMSMNYNGQPTYSQITVLRQADDDGGNASEYTIKNPLCPIVFRPKMETQTSGDDITIQAAAQAELGKQLKSIVLTIEMDRATLNGKLIRPDNTILVRSRKLYLYDPTRWFIEGADFESTPDSEKVTLTCVLPWVYNYNAIGANGKRGPYDVFINPDENFPTESTLLK